MSQKYKNLIFSKHALDRTSLRSVRLEAIYQSVNDSDNSFKQSEDTIKFIKEINKRQHHVVAKKIENGQWLIVSVWVRGEDDPVPLMWQMITFPFKVLWALLKYLYKLLFRKN